MEEDVKGFEGRYIIDTDGNLFSAERQKIRVGASGVKYSSTYSRKKMKPSLTMGYPRVLLFDNNGKKRNEFIHRIVAMQFLPIPSPNHKEVNHKNGIKTDNRLENLEWVTSSENKIHAIKNNLWQPPYGVKCGSCKLTEEQVHEIRANTTSQQKDIANKYNVSIGTIYLIKSGKRWANLKAAN